MQFHPKDLEHIQAHELTVEKIKQDLKHLKTGFPKAEIVKPATLQDGILQFTTEEKEKLKQIYKNSKASVLKFVPASGAASRMFRLLLQFKEEFENSSLSYDDFLNQDKFKPLRSFFDAVENLAFYNDLVLALEEKGVDVNALSAEEKAMKLTKQMLDKDGFDMTNLPKGLIPFHRYKNQSLTAFEEHFYEALTYAVKDKKTNLHFTISPNHIDKFEEKLNEFQPKIESESGVNIQVDFSFQHPSTDTVCIDANGELFRDENDHILFRPAGHGALIENLNQITQDIVFIKNIDNVSHQNSGIEKTPSTLEFKSVLAGHLIQLQEKSFSLLEQLEEHGEDAELLETAVSFLRKKLNVHLTIKNKQDVFHFLNRPIRVCGMVVNKGEPGGGPFWIKNDDGTTSLQIVEKNQINLQDDDQKAKMEASTHFNPVDIVCGRKDYKGNLFDLKAFIDHDRGFVANKFVGGDPIKGLELPGLWNGGMACWNTVFVEVPVESFNPVKAVSDLLKPGHQPKSNV